MTQEKGSVAAESNPILPRWRRAARWLARYELWLTLPVVVLLAFPSQLSPWAMLVVPALWLCRWAGQGTITRRTPVDIPILVLLLTLPVGLWASADLDTSWPVVYQMVAQVTLFYALVNTAHPTRWVTALAGAVVLVALVVAAFNLVEVLVLGERILSERALEGTGPLGVPKRNVMGGTLALLLPIPLALALFWRSARPIRVLLGLATAIVVASLLITQTRGAWIGLVIAVLVIAVVHNRWFALLIPVGLAGALLATFYVGPGPMADLVLSLDVTSSGLSRGELWQRGIYMIQDFPFTGVGPGLYALVGNLLYPLFLVSEYPEHAHNIYLQAAIDHGLPGLVAFVALLMLLLFMAIQAIRRAPASLQRALAIGLLGALVVYLVHGLVETITAYARAGIIVWGVFGVLTVLWLSVHEPGEHELRG